MAHLASFHPASSQLSRVFLVAVAASSMLIAGCDSDTGKADKKVTEQLDASSAKMSGSEADRRDAHQQLDAASRETTASLPVRVRAKALLADSELHTAQALAAAAQSNDVLIERLVREIRLLSSEIDSNNRRAAALARYEPTAPQKAVAQKQADVKGSDDKPDWYKSGDASLQSMSADDKQATALQSQISQLQETIKSESAQRNQLLDQADKLSEQSNHEIKDKSVDLYVQGSGLRKQAADLTVKLDQDNLALNRAQADLAIRQGQHESLTGALKSFDDRSTFFASDWAAVQKQIADLNAQSKSILGDEPVSPAKKNPKTADLSTEMTIGSKAAAIAELARSNHELRGRAETNFNSAIGFYKEAVELSQQLQRDLSDKLAKKTDPQSSPDSVAFDDEKSALDPSGYRFLQADAQLQLGQFFAASASEDKARLDLMGSVKPVLAAAQLAVLTTLDDADNSIASHLKKAQESAREAYTNSTDLLAKVYEGIAPVEQRTPAQIQAIFAQYSWWSLENSAGDPQKAAEHLDFARNAVNAAIADNASLPSLPPELAEVKPAAAHGR